jgi:hypothetical protein
VPQIVNAGPMISHVQAQWPDKRAEYDADDMRA